MLEILDAACPLQTDRDGEVSGLCVQCREWRLLDTDLCDFGVCMGCRDTLRDEIWEGTAVLVELIAGHDESGEIESRAREIAGQMEIVEGAHVAPDPRDKEDV